MTNQGAQIVVAGHICLDIIPAFRPTGAGIGDILRPGKLVDVGPAILATGGPVSNTGLALHRLGEPVALMGKVGDDLLGGAVLEILRRQGPELASGMIVAKGVGTSYTVVLSPPGTDRIFLHCPGANDTFCAADIDYGRLPAGGVFHFGYPPLMRRMYEGNGEEVSEIFRRVKARGLTTSLDMARPDPASDAGRADWPAILRAALPHVDIFCPSIDEILFMLDRPRFERMERAAHSSAATAGTGGGDPGFDGDCLSEIASRLLDMGAALVVLKLGDQGLYLRTSANANRLAVAKDSAWVGRELLSPCFQVDVVGTTGSGDATIAGFLAAMTKGLSPEEAATAATAVGACCCEAADSTSGVRPWGEVQERLRGGWRRREVRVKLDGWHPDLASGLWFGARDPLGPFG